MDYNIPDNLSQNVIDNLCSDVYNYEELIKSFYYHLKNLNKLDKNIDEYKNLTKDQKKDYYKVLIKWKINYYCPVLHNAIENNHDLIMIDNVKLKTKDYIVYYNNLKVYDSVTHKKISENLQPYFADDVYNENKIRFNVKFPWSEVAYKKIMDAVDEFYNFAFGSTEVQIRFKLDDDNKIVSYFYNKTKEKNVHELRQISDYENSIIGLEVDPRRKAIKWYLHFFCKKELELVNNSSNDKNKFQYFIYKENGKRIPDYLQPTFEYINNDNIACLHLIPKYFNDPRKKAIENYNSNNNNSFVTQIKKKHLDNIKNNNV